VKIPFVSSIAVLGLLQILLWFTCFLMVAVMLKSLGYPDHRAPYNSSAVFMREWGLVYALIPAGWTLWASWDLEVNPAPELDLKGHIIIGVMMLIATACLVIVYVSLAGTRRIT